MTKMKSTNKENEILKEGVMKIEMYGYEAIEKIARKSGSTAGIYVPVGWTGKKIKIVRLE